MDINTSYYKINNIPVVEMVPSELIDQPAPLALFYHGWTSNKDESIVIGMELAKRGFRAVLPDSIYHGERHENGGHYEYLQFVECLLQNITEYDELVGYYEDKALIKDDYIAVTGLSMGGITTGMLITEKENISSAGVLMGSPQLLKLARHLINRFLITDKFSEPQVEEDQLIRFIDAYQKFYRLDLSIHTENLIDLPIIFWHGEEDDFVPYDLTKEFIDEIQQKPEGQYVYFTSDEGVAHSVPYKETFRMAVFLEAAYKEPDLSTVWDRTQKLYDEEFPIIAIPIEEQPNQVFDDEPNSDITRL